MENYYKLQYSTHDKPIYKKTTYKWPYWTDWHYFDTSKGNPGNQKRTILQFNSSESSILTERLKDRRRMWRVNV